MQTLKVGDKVHWESQAASSWTVKRGTVVAIVPPGKLPHQTDFGKANRHDCYDISYIFLNYTRMYDSIIPRKHESYLIEVPGGKTAKAMPRLYWPRASQLIKDEKEIVPGSCPGPAGKETREQ